MHVLCVIWLKIKYCAINVACKCNTKHEINACPTGFVI